MFEAKSVLLLNQSAALVLAAAAAKCDPSNK
jgi:hypothetical protein